MVGPKHVMGLAIGNELELLHNHVPWQAKRFPPVCLSMKFLPVTCHVCFYTHFSPFLEKDHHNFCRRSHFRMISVKPRPMRRVSPSSSAAVAFGRPSSSTWPSLHRGEKDEMRRWKLRDVDVTVINVIRM